MHTENDLTRLLWVVGNENWTDPKGLHRGVAPAAQEFARLLYRALSLIFRGSRAQPFQICRQDLLIVNSPVHHRMIRQVYGSSESQPVYTQLDFFTRIRVLASSVRESIRACFSNRNELSLTGTFRVTTKAIESLTLAENLKLAVNSVQAKRVVSFEFGYVGLAVLWLKKTHSQASVFIQHGFLNRFQIPTDFDKFYLNVEWDKNWIASHLGREIDSEFLYSAKSLPPALQTHEKRLLWCLEYPWKQLPSETMTLHMRRFFASLTENGWKIILRAHPFDCDGGKWYSGLLGHQDIEMDSHKDLSIQKSIQNNRCIAVASFSSASMVEALYSGALPILLNHSVKEFIVGNMDRLCLCLDSGNPDVLSDFSHTEPAEIIHLAHQKRDNVFGRVQSPREDLDAPHLS